METETAKLKSHRFCTLTECSIVEEYKLKIWTLVIVENAELIKLIR